MSDREISKRYFGGDVVVRYHDNGDGTFAEETFGGSRQLIWGVNGEAATAIDASTSPLIVTDAPADGEHLVIERIIISNTSDIQVDFLTETDSNRVLSLYLNAYVPVDLAGLGIPLPEGDRLLLQTNDESALVAANVGYYSQA